MAIAEPESPVKSKNLASRPCPIVALGCNCGPKMALQELGMDAESLPFDWMCTCIEAVIGFLSNDFSGFFDYTDYEMQQNPYASKPLTVWRNRYHSWWHADPTSAETREKYTRRINRLMSMEADSSPILFVRSVATTDELSQIELLSKVLVKKFGSQAMLCVVVPGQTNEAAGSYLFDSTDNLTVYMAPSSASSTSDKDGLNSGLDWVRGRLISRATQLQDVDELIGSVTPCCPGYKGMMGIDAFDTNAPNIFPRQYFVNSGAGGSICNNPFNFLFGFCIRADGADEEEDA